MRRRTCFPCRLARAPERRRERGFGAALFYFDFNPTVLTAMTR